MKIFYPYELHVPVLVSCNGPTISIPICTNGFDFTGIGLNGWVAFVKDDFLWH